MSNNIVHLKLQVAGQSIRVTQQDKLVAGSVNVYTVEFGFDSAWDGYTPVAVFEGADINRVVSRSQTLRSNQCTIPWETLLPHGNLRIGVYGVTEDKRLPTVYTAPIPVGRGTESAVESIDPTPGVIDQILSQVAEDRAIAQGAADRAEGSAAAAELARVGAEDARDVAVNSKEEIERLVATAPHGIGMKRISFSIPSSSWSLDAAFSADFPFCAQVICNEASDAQFPVAVLDPDGDNIYTAKRCGLCPTMCAQEGVLLFWANMRPDLDIAGTVVLLSAPTTSGTVSDCNCIAITDADIMAIMQGTLL